MRFTQNTYDIIVKVLQNGAPALANELISAIDDLFAGYKRLERRVNKLTAIKKEETNGIR